MPRKPMSLAKAKSYAEQLADPEIEFEIVEDSLNGVPVFSLCVRDQNDDLRRVCMLLNDAVEADLAEAGASFGDDEDENEEEGAEDEDDRGRRGRKAFSR